MTGLWFKLAANDRPVELRANVFATIGVGVCWPRLLSAPSSALTYSRRSRQMARGDSRWSDERRVLPIESCMR